MPEMGEIELFAPHEGPFMKFPMDLNLLHNPAAGTEFTPVPRGTWLQGGDLTKLKGPVDVRRRRVAVIDSGVLTNHSWIAAVLEPGGCMDFTGEGGEDQNGHGTVTALLTLAAWQEPITLISCRVVGSGGPRAERLIHALKWVAANGNIDWVVLSAGVFLKRWGRPAECDGTCPVCQAALRVVSRGTFISAAGGNSVGQLACPATLAKRGHEGIIGAGPLDANGRGVTYVAGAAIPYESHGTRLQVSRPPSRELARAYELSTTDPHAAIVQLELIGGGADADEAAFATSQLGELYERLGRVGDAIACYRKAVALGHSWVSPIAGIRLGNLLGSAGKNEAAIGAYRSVVELGDRVHSAMAAFNLGNLFLGTADYEAAEASFQEAVAFGNPEWSVKALKNLGIAQWQRGRIADARHSFLQILSGMPSPEQASAALNLGMMESELGNLEAAEKALSSSLATGDARVRPLAAINLGDVLIRLGATVRARDAYQLAVDQGAPGTSQGARAALRELDSRG